MKKYGVNELREMFLSFFEEKGCLRLGSFSLVPHNDKSLLIINSGMAPMKPWFTGQEIPPRRRVTTCQKCIRTGDLENVGKTARHGTFFEMLGNFSFGDYFKKEAIPWAWEFLTERVGLDPERLYPSVYVDDDEAYNIWLNDMHVPADHIYRFGKEDNFWEHGSGPCGPCSEIYYDRGEKYGNGPEDVMGGEGDRYMEVWNIVFSQFNNDGHGHYTDLVQKNIDTGMGLERLAVAVQDVGSIFDVDTVKSLRDLVCRLAGGIGYEEPGTEESDVSVRIVTDHAHGRKLGIQGSFLPTLAMNVIDGSRDGYPELEEKRDFILNVIRAEEEKFEKTYGQGMEILASMEEELEGRGSRILSGDDAFRLYDTYGFPLDNTKDILAEKGFTVDEAGFEAAMKRQRETARQDRKNDSGEENAVTGALTDGQTGAIITSETPFYGTMGGQIGDRGVITSPGGTFAVERTEHVAGSKIAHIGHVTGGMFRTGDTVTLKVDAENRMAICRNHSATHLLQRALREVLGSHVEQAGSYQDASRTRFDFSHFKAMTPEELKKVEDLVNRKIAEDLPVTTEVMSLDEARKTGAMALFGEKYGDRVRVVRMGDFSTELCGGTHVSHTGQIRLFKIVSENGVASGVRRIEALTGDNVIAWYAELENEMNESAALLKAAPSTLADHIRRLQEDLKAARSENEALKAKAAQAAMGDAASEAEEIGGVRVLVRRLDGVGMNDMRNLGDELKESLGDAYIILASVTDGKVSLMATASDGAVKKGAHAGNLIRSAARIVGGGGGGRPNMAQAGGKDPSKTDEALAEAKRIAREQLG